MTEKISALFHIYVLISEFLSFKDEIKHERKPFFFYFSSKECLKNI